MGAVQLQQHGEGHTVRPGGRSLVGSLKDIPDIPGSEGAGVEGLKAVVLGGDEGGREPVQVREVDISGDAAGGWVVLVGFCLSKLGINRLSPKCSVNYLFGKLVLVLEVLLLLESSSFLIFFLLFSFLELTQSFTCLVKEFPLFRVSSHLEAFLPKFFFKNFFKLSYGLVLMVEKLLRALCFFSKEFFVLHAKIVDLQTYLVANDVEVVRAGALADEGVEGGKALLELLVEPVPLTDLK